MRGLIIKDLLFIKKTWKNLIVMFIGALMISFSIGNYLLALCVIPVMLLASGITTFQNDEFYNTESYTLASPLSRFKIVTSRYLYTLILLVVATWIGLILYELINIIFHPGYNGLNQDMIRQLLMFELASLFIDSIFYPIIYKYGCEKSRFVLMSLVMILLGICSIASLYINYLKIKIIDIEAIVNFIENHGLTALSIIIVISYTLSYILSNVFYKHRDF